MNLNERIADLAAPAAAEAGLIVDEVRVHGAGKSTRVVITLDLPEDAVGSADMDAIATASRGIGAALDAADIIDAAYLLEIGSPGVGRPLTERRHFMRARTRLLHIELAAGGTLGGTDAIFRGGGATGGRRVPPRRGSSGSKLMRRSFPRSFPRSSTPRRS